jgi:HK97 family phage major capsid protein
MQIALKEGELERYEQLETDFESRNKTLKSLRAAEERNKQMKRDYESGTNIVPTTEPEVRDNELNREERGARTHAAYKPRGWAVDTDTHKPLPPAVQPAWVREHMGSALKEEERFYIETYEKWMRHRSHNDFFNRLASDDEKRAMNEGTDGAGGFFVPEDFRTTLIHDPGAPGGQIRPKCTVYTTSLKDGYMPSIQSVTWAAIAEEAAYGDNTPTTGQVSFNVKKSGGQVLYSAELLEDAAFGLPAITAQIFNEARGRFEDQKIIAGDGTNEPEGLRTALDVSADTYSTLFASTTAVVAVDMIKVYWSLPAQFRDGGTWYTSSTFMQQLMSIGATAAGIHFGGGADNVDLTVTPMGQLMGAPIVLFDGTGWDDATAIAQDELFGVFGNFRNYYLIDRIGMSLRRDDSINVKTDQVWFGARARFDGRVGLLNAFRLFGAAT